MLKTLHHSPEGQEAVYAAAPLLLQAVKDLLGDEPGAPVHDFAVNDQDELTCLGCGRDQGDLDINVCESDDCPRFQARQAIAQAEGAASGLCAS